jgi:hypothetical protein
VIKALRGVGERIVIILIPTELWVQIVALFLKLGDSCPSAAAINRLCGPASPQNADGQLKKADRRSSKPQIVTDSAFSSPTSQSAINYPLVFIGGAEGARTPGLMTASHALSQLSYSPMRKLKFFNKRSSACQQLFDEITRGKG